MESLSAATGRAGGCAGTRHIPSPNPFEIDYPALPFDSAPGSPVYWLGTNTAGYGIYLIDDSEFEESSLGGMAAVSRMATMLDATQDSGGAGWPSVNYSSTDLWLEITNNPGPANFQITHPHAGDERRL